MTKAQLFLNFTVILSIAGLAFAVGESFGNHETRNEFKPTEQELIDCYKDLADTRKAEGEAVQQTGEMAKLVGDFADQQRVTTELVQDKLGITPEMIAEAVAKDKAAHK